MKTTYTYPIGPNLDPRDAKSGMTAQEVAHEILTHEVKTYEIRRYKDGIFRLYISGQSLNRGGWDGQMSPLLCYKEPLVSEAETQEEAWAEMSNIIVEFKWGGDYAYAISDKEYEEMMEELEEGEENE